jgi:hypothetical protein
MIQLFIGHWDSQDSLRCFWSHCIPFYVRCQVPGSPLLSFPLLQFIFYQPQPFHDQTAFFPGQFYCLWSTLLYAHFENCFRSRRRFEIRTSMNSYSLDYCFDSFLYSFDFFFNLPRADSTFLCLHGASSTFPSPFELATSAIPLISCSTFRESLFNLAQPFPTFLDVFQPYNSSG